MNSNNAEIATIHLYFVIQLLKDLSRTDESIGDLFGYGEDTFVVDLYQYSEIIWNEFDTVDLRKSKLFDVYIEASKIFWTQVLSQEAPIMQKSLPCKQSFQSEVKNILREK